VPGPPGVPGTAAKIVGASASTVAAGTPATVTLGGTETERTFSFEIPQGAQGNPGDAGVDAKIVEATATTVPAGAPATVTLGGTETERTFAFEIPQGAPGDPGTSGSSELIGSGKPEGVVTATRGTIYFDTAATKGALKWVKTTPSGNTGWRVLYGNTGWVQVSSLQSGYRAGSGGYFYVQRIGEQVRFGVIEFYQQESASNNAAFVLPTGYRPQPGSGFTPTAQTPFSVYRSSSPREKIASGWVDLQGTIRLDNWVKLDPGVTSPRGELYGEFTGTDPLYPWP
jgi:hypothetical protein